jgi:uncharacterized repeat protein (TIGR02543 family)
MKQPKNKIKTILLLTLLCLIAGLTLSACGETQAPYTPPAPVITYKVTFFLSDGEVYTTVEVKEGKAIILPDDPTKEGYIFDGWVYLDNNLSIAFDTSIKITANISVTAKWISDGSPDPDDPNVEYYTRGLIFTPITDGYKVSAGTTENKTEIVIPMTYKDEPVLEIDNSFRVCTKLEKLTIPFVGNKLHRTGNVFEGYSSELFRYIFWNSSYVPASLSEVIVTGGTSIGYEAFANCSGLTTISLLNVTSIGGYAFFRCSGLTTITIPNVTSIGEYAFYECSGLTSITLPNVTSIGEDAFKDCDGLTTISLPNVTSIGV